MLRAIVKWARTTYTQKEIGITSTTGIASKLIGGRTIHSWAGIQPGNEDLAVQLNRIQQSATTVTRWKTARIIVIDEGVHDKTLHVLRLSSIQCRCLTEGYLMFWLVIHSRTLSKCLGPSQNQIAQALRESHQPFGGIQVCAACLRRCLSRTYPDCRCQLVLTGDFYQLPPVRENSYRNEFSPAYAFHSITWRLCIQRPMFLNQVFRQTDNCKCHFLRTIRLLTLRKVSSTFWPQ